MEHGLGRLALPRDERDYSVTPLLAAKPTAARSYRYWFEGGPLILDQGATGTCEGNGWTSYLIDGPVTHPDFPSFANASEAEQYAQALYLEATGDETLQNGAYTRQVLDVLVRRGLAASYHRCATVDEVVSTLLNLGPVGHASTWYRSMFDPETRWGNSYVHVDEASGVAGGHEYLLTGVNLAPSSGPPFVRMQNSWGTGWGHGGTARIALEDLAVLFVGDAYVLAEKAF